MNFCEYCSNKTLNKRFCSQSCSARFTNAKRSRKSLDEYLENPNTCVLCGRKITPNLGQKLSEAKQKKFCNHVCAAKYNNSFRNGVKYRGRANSKAIICPECGGKKSTRSNMCKNCAIRDRLFGNLYKTTKGKLFGQRGYFRARALIQTHSLKMWRILDGGAECKICGYSKHIHVCHKKSVSSFSDESTILEINDIDNLIALCPNHHYEYDNGLLEIK